VEVKQVMVSLLMEPGFGHSQVPPRCRWAQVTDSSCASCPWPFCSSCLFVEMNVHVLVQAGDVASSCKVCAVSLRCGGGRCESSRPLLSEDLHSYRWGVGAACHPVASPSWWVPFRLLSLQRRSSRVTGAQSPVRRSAVTAVRVTLG